MKKTIEQIRSMLKLEAELRGQPEDWKNWYSRAAVYNKEGMNIEERSIDNIVATEKAVLVFDWYRWEPVWEVLLMDGVEFPESKQIPFLDQHSRYSINNLLGSVRGLKKVTDERIGKVIMGRVFVSDEYSKVTPDPWKLIEQGHLTDTSIGYKTFDDATVFLKKGEKTKIKGVEYVHNLGGDYGLAIREKTELKEDSAVLIGADDLAKFQRSYLNQLGKKVESESAILGKKKYFILDNSKPIIKRSNTMKIKDAEGNIIEVDVNLKDTPEFRTELDAELNKRKTDDAAREKANNDRIAEILATAEEYRNLIPDSKPGEKAQELIRDGKTAVDYFRWAQGEMKKPQPSRRSASIADELSSKEIQKYEMRMAVLNSLGKEIDVEKEVRESFGEDGIASLGIVREVSETLKKRHKNFAAGTLIDTGILDKRSEMFREKLKARTADQLVTGNTYGGYTVNEQVISQSFIEYLSNLSAFIQGGVKVLPGMVGTIPFVRELDENVGYWVGESVAPTTSKLSFSRTSVGPKTVGAKTSISRQMLMQSAWVSEAYLRSKLGGTVVRKVDKGIYDGAGSATEIEGIKNVTGVYGIDGSGFTRAKALLMLGSIWTANADVSSLSWVTSRAIKSLLMGKDVTAGFGKWLWEENNSMIAIPGKDTNQISAADLILGVLSTIYLLEWGILEVDANPYGTGWAAGDLEVKALLSCNTFYEYPQSLAIAENVS